MGLLSWTRRDQYSSVYRVLVDPIREAAGRHDAERKKLKADRLTVPSERVSEVEVEDVAPDAPPMCNTTPRTALIEALKLIEVGGQRVQEQNPDGIARTLMRRMPDHYALMCALSTLTRENLDKIGSKRNPIGYLIDELVRVADQMRNRVCASVSEKNHEVVRETVEGVLSGELQGARLSEGSSPAFARALTAFIEEHYGQLVKCGEIEGVLDDDGNVCVLVTMTPVREVDAAPEFSLESEL
jgi:hypothetical protein